MKPVVDPNTFSPPVHQIQQLVHALPTPLQSVLLVKGSTVDLALICYMQRPVRLGIKCTEIRLTYFDFVKVKAKKNNRVRYENYLAFWLDKKILVKKKISWRGLGKKELLARKIF